MGSLAMANAGPNTNGSQFFIISGPDGMRLPPQYSLFGKVVSGLDVVKAINDIGTPTGRPLERVTIDSVIDHRVRRPSSRLGLGQDVEAGLAGR